jgi:hypothetical protein
LPRVALTLPLEGWPLLLPLGDKPVLTTCALLPRRNFPANGAATPAKQAESSSQNTAANPGRDDTMKLNRLTGAIATVAILSGCGISHHAATAAPADPGTIHAATAHLLAAHPAPAASPSLTWLESAGGQAQVTFNDDVDTLAGALVIENQVGTVANHLIFEADARTVRTEARTILADPALLPATHRAAYQTMLNDFITVANMPGYGTTAQDYTAWYTALRASNITVF